MYRFHKVFYDIKKKIKNKNIKFIYSSFKFPPLDNNNFRYREEHGGFFWDAATYPLSLDIFFFIIRKKFKIINNYKQKNKKLLQGVIIQKSKEIIKIYKWGVGQKYENNLEIICDDKTYFVNKIFSKLKNEKIFLEEILNNEIKKKIFIDNQFEKMFLEVFKKYNLKKFRRENNKNIFDCFNHFNKIFKS